ncbi:MAG: hypothetical protein ED556_03370 [Winogradskyella sp.]|uniref:hypothetical protein n=1 Tax=Winogradskyella sp. TaxID=1883156 RepID=UPI000F4162AE|nr:hypothetical protein [Winogradskyella sp.]RNC88237.1 MAG: hypothetical protein ED556_03370 [Winogradskyella sp.]
MKKNSLNFIITIILAFLLSQVLPWWSVMVASFISALLISLNKSAVFFIPFLAVLVFWTVHAFILGNANDFILAKKIAVLLSLGGNPYVLVLVTGIVGGLAAGVSALFGKQLSLVFKS